MLKCYAVTSVLRASPLNWALGFKEEVVSVDTTLGIQKFGFH